MIFAKKREFVWVLQEICGRERKKEKWREFDGTGGAEEIKMVNWPHGSNAEKKRRESFFLKKFFLESFGNFADEGTNFEKKLE